MCTICVLWNKEKITREEALLATFELAITEEDQQHIRELYSYLESLDTK